jgi:hypothetical protein
MPSSCACAAVYAPRLEQIERSLQYLLNKQEAQYEILVGGIQDLNVSLKLLIQQANTVETATTIPNLAPQSQGSDLKNVSVAMAEPTSVAEPEAEAEVEAEEAEVEHAEAEEEVEEDADAEVEDEMEVDAEGAEVEADAEAEADVEVEEWTYKGRLFFKDSENVVYANNAGEIGDPIGQYDPSKNIVKKLPTN